jgi:GNAT superfamily N-acetyltransferase
VRPATPDDAASIVAVDVESWRAAYHGLMPDAYLDALSAEDKAAGWAASLGRQDMRGKRTLVVEDAEDGVIGYATVGPETGSNDGLLYLMYVLPEHWRRGAGRALMQGAADALRALGYERAVLDVLEANDRARRFYEATGWTPSGARRTDDYGGVELVAIRYATAL